MRYAINLLVLLALVAFSSAAFADPPAPRHDVVHGIVKSVEGKTITVTIGKGDTAKDVVVQTDDETRFTVDHQPSKLEDVKAGELVAVGPAEGVAHHVDLNTTHKDSVKHALLHGIVKKVDGLTITIMIGKGDNAREAVVQTDVNTRFTVDHEPSKLDDVKEGELIAVAPAEGIAHHVDLNTTHKDSVKHALLHGIVKKVDGLAITIEIGKGDKAREVVVQTDANTKFTVDHEPGKLEDIKEGELVGVAPAEGVAQHIDLNTTHKGPAK